MNTAEAMAQIQTVMSAAEEPVACVLLEAGGKMREVIADNRQLGKVLGGSPTIVGALRLLDVTAAATTRGAATTAQTSAQCPLRKSCTCERDRTRRDEARFR